MSLLFTSLVRLRFDSQGFSYLQLTYIFGVCQDLRRQRPPRISQSLQIHHAGASRGLRCGQTVAPSVDMLHVKTVKNKESKMLKRNDRNDFTNDSKNETNSIFSASRSIAKIWTRLSLTYLHLISLDHKCWRFLHYLLEVEIIISWTFKFFTNCLAPSAPSHT